MLKRLIIILTFLAYQINLVHSILPHHHHDAATAVISHSHEHQDAVHHSHHDDDHESSDNDFNLTHLIAEVAHNPSSASVIHNATSEDSQKSKTVVDLLLSTTSEVLVIDNKPSLERTTCREFCYDSRFLSASPLRGPPVA